MKTSSTEGMVMKQYATQACGGEGERSFVRDRKWCMITSSNKLPGETSMGKAKTHLTNGVYI